MNHEKNQSINMQNQQGLEYNFSQERLKFYISICNLHRKRLISAIDVLQQIVPLSIEKYEELTEQEISYIDQMSYRFGKLQDTTGRLLKILLVNLGEDIENSPFIDVLNRAEKLKIIESAQEWIILRKLRNILTHEYSEEEKDIVDGINKLFEISNRLCEIYKKIKTNTEQLTELAN
ncbi:MAG: hypothetical protein AB1414_01735 [bacterium]